MTKSITNVPAATVRAWARENMSSIPAEGHKCLGETARGRLHPTVTEAYAAAHKGKGYTPKVAEVPTVTFKAVQTDGSGRKVTKPVTIPTAEARALIGQTTSDKGRLPMGKVTDAWEATYADGVADTFTNAA